MQGDVSFHLVLWHLISLMGGSVEYHIFENPMLKIKYKMETKYSSAFKRLRSVAKWAIIRMTKSN